MASGLSLVFLLCLTFGMLISGSASFRFIFPYRGCPYGWTKYGSRCYIVQTRWQSMADAERTCIRLGGNLVSIHSVGENSFVRRLIYRRCRSYVTAWIGLFDAIQEGRWMWTNGKRVGLTCWARWQPNNLGRREHCTQINYAGPYWNDRPCSDRRPFVCAKQA